MKVLNKQAIEAMRPGQTKHDGQTRGLYVLAGRERKDGKLARTWIWHRVIKKKALKTSLGHWPDMTLEAARREAETINRAIDDGKNPFAPEAAFGFEALHVAALLLTAGVEPAVSDKTFADLERGYFERHAEPYKSERSVKDDRYLLKQCVPADWRARMLSSFAWSEVDTLHKTIAREHAGRKNGHYAANRTMRLLRCMFNFAIKSGYIKRNPVVGIKFYPEPKRERYLTPNELKLINDALMQEPDWRWRAYFPLCLMLGTRRCELLAAQWENVDFERRTITIPKTKSGRPLKLPLPTLALELLAGLPSRGASEWVFPCDETGRHQSKSGHLENANIAWARIRERAGVKDCRLHDLRHTLASWRAAEGDSLLLIGKILNHSQVSTTERYTTIDLDPVRKALEENSRLMFPTGLPKLALPEPAARRERPADVAESVATA